MQKNENIVVEIIDEENAIVESKVERFITEAVVATLHHHKLRAGEVSVVLVPAVHIRSLNAEYRGKDAVTDVLSFPQYESMEEIVSEDYPYYGDVVICIERAEEQAKEYGHSFERELAYLTVHSVLHLLGYDHEEEKERMDMRTVEKEVMKALGIYKTEDKTIQN